MLKRIAKFALFGAVGFGTGWLLKELVIHLKVYGFWALLEWFEGALGGLALGLASERRGKRLVIISVLVGIGFSAGVFVGNYVAQWLSAATLEQYLIAYGLLTGAFGGIALGFALGGWKKAGVSALAGALAFSILPVIMEVWLPVKFFDRGSIIGSILLYFPGIIGGGLFGAAVGYLEKG